MIDRKQQHHDAEHHYADTTAAVVGTGGAGRKHPSRAEALVVTAMNLGILAHVDAGKTSLTERLLFESGATRWLGSVDSGTTRTDSMPLEQQRGITIRATVTAVTLNDHDVNIIDTPGHSDFTAEVERALGVLDCAVLVLSAVEGVQPQTVILWRALRRVGVPTAFFINKVDRGGADPDRVAEQIRARLNPSLVILSRCCQPGTVHARAERRALADPSVVEAVAETDPTLLDRWADGTSFSDGEITAEMRRQVTASRLSPVVFGSAITGTGTDALQWVLTELLPPLPVPGSEPSGVVFAVDHDAGGRRSWIRVWSGSVHVRDKLALGARKPARVTGLVIPTPRGDEERKVAHAGDIAAVRGLNTGIGESFGALPPRVIPRLSPPTLQAVVTPTDPAQRGTLFAGLSELADEDPLIGLEMNESHGNATVRIHGEVQKEVIAALLEERFGVQVVFEDTTVVCIESVVGSGHALEEMHCDDNPYLATIGLEIVAAPELKGVSFSSGVERGKLPASFIGACEEGVRSTLAQGLHGWPVTGCRVTLTASGYAPRQSHSHQKFNKAMSSVGADFRHLAPVVTMACLKRAGTRVCEPVERFDLEVPSWSLSTVISVTGRLGVVVSGTVEAGPYHHISGSIRSAKLGELLRSLPDITGGEGVLGSTMSHYEPVVGDREPVRTRLGAHPGEREVWFREMPR